MNQPVGSGMWPAALAGSAAFWLANVVISVTPVAAEYRAGLSISYVPMLAQAVAGGLVLGLAVSHVLHRHFDRIPTRTPVAKSIVVSLFALGAVTVLVEVPGKFLTDTENPVRYLVIGRRVQPGPVPRPRRGGGRVLPPEQRPRYGQTPALGMSDKARGPHATRSPPGLPDRRSTCPTSASIT